MTKIYHFDPITKEYRHATDARLDPKDDTPMVPGGSTLLAPPSTPAGYAAVWEGEGWVKKVDLRGQEYWLADGSRHLITDIGATLPADALDAQPVLPVRKTAEEAKQAAYRWIEAFVHEHVDGSKPQSEISTYQGREMAARAVQAGSASTYQQDMLTALLTFEGKTPAQAAAEVPALVVKIIALADARNTALALTTAMREKVEAIIASADVASDPFAFDKVLAQAALDAQAAWEQLSA